MATASKTPSLSVSLEPFTGIDDGLSTLAAAKVFEVTSKESCEVLLVDTKRWKKENREIEAYYDNQKDGIVYLLRTAYERAREMRDAHLRPRKLAIAEGEKRIVEWNRAAEQREREESDRVRREAEAAEQARREKEAAEAEAAALELEASAHNLSDRERRVVEMLGPLPTPADWLKACRLAGYKDFKVAAARLFDSAKIQQAIENHRKALEIRLQSEAAKAAPIMVETPAVETQVATVAGTSVRTYFACDPQVDLRKLAAAVLAGTVPLDAIQPNMVHLNAQARSLKTMFDAAYPGCRATRREGITG